jgi:hypothetical protein
MMTFVATGKPGDSPFTDILNYRRTVYGYDIDLLIVQIVALGG